MVGTAVGAGAAVIGTDYASSVANAIVTGTIAPCGSGTFVVRYFVVYDLHNVAAGRPGTWEVVEGLGTGDLASLTGDGTFTITQTNPDLSSISAWKGKLHCRPPAPEKAPGSATNNEGSAALREAADSGLLAGQPRASGTAIDTRAAGTADAPRQE